MYRFDVKPAAVLPSRLDVSVKLVTPSPYRFIFVEIVNDKVFAAPGHGVDCATFLVTKDGAYTLKGTTLLLSQDALQVIHGGHKLQAIHPQNGGTLELTVLINCEGIKLAESILYPLLAVGMNVNGEERITSLCDDTEKILRVCGTGDERIDIKSYNAQLTSERLTIGGLEYSDPLEVIVKLETAPL